MASGLNANLVDALTGGAMGRLTLLVSTTFVPTPAWNHLTAKSVGQGCVLAGTGAVNTAIRPRSVALMSPERSAGHSNNRLAGWSLPNYSPIRPVGYRYSAASASVQLRARLRVRP
jgi:hypothetical protein